MVMYGRVLAVWACWKDDDGVGTKWRFRRKILRTNEVAESVGSAVSFEESLMRRLMTFFPLSLFVGEEKTTRLYLVAKNKLQEKKKRGL